jgi:glycosidase
MTIGNHDVARFASVAAGDGDGDGWTPAAQPTDPTVYARQRMALAIVFTLPGAPVVYYGDEIALAGHADPDSRRVLPADEALTPAQAATKGHTRLLGRARACEASLRRGTYRSIASDAEHLIYARELDGAESALVVLQRNVEGAYSTPLPGIPAGDWVDVLSGAQVHVDPAGTVFDSRPLTAALYVPASSACATAP